MGNGDELINFTNKHPARFQHWSNHEVSEICNAGLRSKRDVKGMS